MKFGFLFFASALTWTLACSKPGATDRSNAPSEFPSAAAAPAQTGAPSHATPTFALGSGAAAPTASTSASADAAPSAPSAPAPNATMDPKVLSAFAFQTTRNIEMVPYCLPYPSAYLVPDTSERWEHGHQVFVRKGAKKGTLPSRMDLQGVCGPRSLKQLYEYDRKQIASEVKEEAITVSAFRGTSYALSWTKGNRIHYGKMWSAKNDPGCFVRATFEYDPSERAAFDGIIAQVAAADPTCP